MSYLVLLWAILLGQLQYWMLVSIEHTDKYKGQNFQSRTCHPPCTLLTHNMRLKVFKASNTYAYFLHLLPLYLTNNNMRVKKFFGNGTPSCPLLVLSITFKKLILIVLFRILSAKQYSESERKSSITHSVFQKINEHFMCKHNHQLTTTWLDIDWRSLSNKREKKYKLFPFFLLINIHLGSINKKKPYKKKEISKLLKNKL